ncbi:hypothetical protein SLS53_009066 [Cytospora paraplurivora]|uniref:Berberine/berberine-like domain-containing protein n=1 Tax=Cytospora paraplurivora TaxID=2898453 RepID=A0AAN9U5W8_9PEZI
MGTKGVHISLTRFNQVVLSDDESTAEIGFGLTWAEVYQKLDGTGAYNVVLPNGTITTASSDKNPDLFFALKGGLNRFAIVTSAVYKTHPQDKIYIILTIEGISGLVFTPVVLFFYDGEDPGDSFVAFDDILATIDTVLVQSFSDFVGAQAVELLTNPRGTSHTVSVSSLTSTLLDAVKTQVEDLTKKQLLHSGSLVTVDVDPFLQYGQYSTDSAYPHADSPLPISLYVAWDLATADDFWKNATKSAIASIKKVAVQEGVFKDTFTSYPNYAIAGTTAEELYGTNTARLRSIRQSIDPDQVMQLAGGFDLL